MSKRNENIEDEVMVSSPSVLFSDPKFFEFCANVSMMDVDVDTEALTAEFEEEYVKTRKGDFGKILNYVPSKYIRERLNDVLGCKWSFMPVVEQRVSDPLPKYDKNEEEYIESDSYIKILGLLIIPGLGVQAQYGVKKTYGYGEANDWKAATTDAFKKCCSAFGIEADYDIDDDEEDVEKKPVEKVDIDELEYDDDELEEALETEVTFGKYKELSLEEIYEEDASYIEWLMDNANDQDMRVNAAIVHKHFSESESKKSKKKTGSKEKAGKSSSKTTSKSKEKAGSKTSNKKKTSTKKKTSDEDEDKKQELIDSIQEIFDEDEEYYDEVTIISLIQSVSISKKNPDGKEELEDLNIKELENLAETLMEEDEDEDDE